jgi:nucleoid DNA-binding protein
MLRNHKNKIDYDTKYYYREFRKLHKDLEVSQKEYTNVLQTFFQIVIEKIVHEAYRFKLPGIGLFYLSREKQTTRINKDGTIKFKGTVNWPATKELINKTGDKTKRVYYMNDHTDRNIYSIAMDKREINFKNKSFYVFRINKKHKQYLQQSILSAIKPLNAYKLWYR